MMNGWMNDVNKKYNSNDEKRGKRGKRGRHTLESRTPKWGSRKRLINFALIPAAWRSFFNLGKNVGTSFWWAIGMAKKSLSSFSSWLSVSLRKKCKVKKRNKKWCISGSVIKERGKSDDKETDLRRRREGGEEEKLKKIKTCNKAKMLWLQFGSAPPPHRLNWSRFRRSFLLKVCSTFSFWGFNSFFLISFIFYILRLVLCSLFWTTKKHCSERTSTL